MHTECMVLGPRKHLRTGEIQALNDQVLLLEEKTEHEVSLSLSCNPSEGRLLTLKMKTRETVKRGNRFELM